MNTAPLDQPSAVLDLSHLPPIFLSTTHFSHDSSLDEVHDFESALIAANARLTYSPAEAEIILSRATKKARAKFDLRSLGIWTTDLENSFISVGETPRRGVKRKRGHRSPSEENRDSSIETDEEVGPANKKAVWPLSHSAELTGNEDGSIDSNRLITVVQLNWFTDSTSAGKALPLEAYATYQGRPTTPPIAGARVASQSQGSTQSQVLDFSQAQDILARAKEDQSSHGQSHLGNPSSRQAHNASVAFHSSSQITDSSSATQYAHLLRTTTTEHDEGLSSELPEMPQWVQQNLRYACQRPTPRSNPNEKFISSLQAIKTARLLTGDDIGVRAYSTSIAAISAYPHPLTSPREILALPGCDAKIANLFVEWKNTDGHIRVVADLDANPDIQTLRLFYDIWGVGATTAREFYFDKGWRDLDDVVEFGWASLSRVQQIGVKYYEEFLDRIPRAEVERIASVIHHHAVQLRDDRIQSLLVGGYRRGNLTCGDVDIIISHPDESQTLNLILDLVTSLEATEHITHTLHLSLHNSHRSQQPLPYRHGTHPSSGFDTLDKALLVWQDPLSHPHDQGQKNTNIHRRVDIIISPWRSVGCAVLAWTGGTTFERDLRRFAKTTKNWKFDSSGVRDRGSGLVVDLEGAGGDGGDGDGGDGGGEKGRSAAKSMEEAERRVFEGFGLKFLEPEVRCTG